MQQRLLAVLSSAWLGALCIPSLALAAPPAPSEAEQEAPERKRMSEKMGERVSRGIVAEGLDTLDEAENQARLGRILNSPQMREAIRDLTASLVTGVYDGIREARASGEVDATNAIADGIDKRVTPALGRLAYRVVGSAVSASLTDKQIARLEILGERAGHATIRGVAMGVEQDLGPAFAATIERDLGPALAVMIERDLLPALGRGLETPEMQTVLRDVSRSAATGIVEGAGEAIDVKSASNEAEGKQSGLQLFGDRVAIGYGVALFFAFAFGTLIVVLTVLLVRYSRRLRKQSEAARQRESALLSLVDSLETDNPELKADMRELLQSQLDAA